MSIALELKGSTRNFIRENRETLVLSCTALAITFFLLTIGFRGNELYLGWILLGIAFGLSKRSIGNKWVFGGLVFLLLSHALSVPGSIWWGRGHWEVTLYHTVWITPFILLYLINTSEKVYLWLIPILTLHSAFIVLEKFINFGVTDRRIGLLDNANPAASLLTIGVVFLLHTKFRWITPLLVVALFFNGQRSGLTSLAIMIGIITAVTLVRKQWTILFTIVLVIGVSSSIILGTSYGQETRGLWTGPTLETGLNDLVIRWEMTDTPSILPKGVTHSYGLHALVQRIAVELGILAAIVWVSITAYSLLQKPWFNSSWWILLTIIVLSVTEYSVWLGPLAAIWWITIGLRIKTNDSNY